MKQSLSKRDSCVSRFSRFPGTWHGCHVRGYPPNGATGLDQAIWSTIGADDRGVRAAPKETRSVQPRRQLDVRYQGVLAACLSLALVAVVALVGLRYFSDPESAPHNLTPTSIAAITPAPVEATPDVLPSPGNLPAASPTA